MSPTIVMLAHASPEPHWLVTSTQYSPVLTAVYSSAISPGIKSPLRYHSKFKSSVSGLVGSRYTSPPSQRLASSRLGSGVYCEYSGTDAEAEPQPLVTTIDALYVVVVENE